MNFDKNAQKPERLYSLDALRGFDMFWIMGGDGLFRALAKVTNNATLNFISNQLEHVEWNGFHFYDMIFPLFLFISGVSSTYSVNSMKQKGKNNSDILKKIFKRTAILVLLGMIVNNGINFYPLSSLRFPSVLGRIGIAYMFANIIYLYCKPVFQKIIFVVLLIGYWLLLMFTSAPGFPPGDLTMQGNFVSYVDRMLLPGKLYNVIHDPEGILSTIPAISTALLGIFTGVYLKRGTTSIKKVITLLLTGIIFIFTAQLWNVAFPINKNLWTSSFMLQAGGLSLVLLAIFYYINDVLKFRKWAFFFVVIGMNPILIYISGVFISWDYITTAFFGWLFKILKEPWTAVWYFVGYISVKWILLYFLYKKNIFLKV